MVVIVIESPDGGWIEIWAYGGRTRDERAQMAINARDVCPGCEDDRSKPA